MSTLSETLRTWAVHEPVTDHRARVILGMLAAVAATTAGAYAAVPLPWTPVPMTLQPLFVLLSGALLGPWAGAGAMALYLAAGASGLPVFSGGGAGIPWLLGPTGGYLAAFPAAAFVTGLLAGRDERSWLRLGLAFALGVVVLYAGGLSRLWLLTGEDLAGVLAIGAAPFVMGDLLKVLIGVAVVRAARAFPGGPS